MGLLPPSTCPGTGSCLGPPSASSIVCARAHLHLIRVSAFAHLKFCVFLPRKHLDLPSREDRDCALYLRSPWLPLAPLSAP